MDIVKNNLVSIILGVIALVALTTPFWLISGYVGDLQAKGAQSLQANSGITTLLNRTRVMPAPTPEGQPQPLEQFPNEATIANGEQLRTDVQESAQRMLDRAIEMNRQSLLVEGSLPEPRGNDPFIFRDRYNDHVKPRLIRRDILNGGMPPTPDEIKIAQERLWTDVYVHQIRGVGGGRTNKDLIDRVYQQEAAKVGNQLTTDRARQIKMYIEPDAFTWHRAFEATSQPPTAEEIWFAQLGIWIQTNVANAIAEVNANSSSVLDSPVKHLIRIEFADNPYVLPAPATGSSSSSEYEDPYATPAQATQGDPSQPLPADLARSVTGRISNSLFDVVHFQVILVADAMRFPELLQSFVNQRLLYVRTYRIESVDSAGQHLAGFVYGNTPVIRAELDMEMLFFRDWTVDLMPERIRGSLGIPTRRGPTGVPAAETGW